MLGGAGSPGGGGGGAGDGEQLLTVTIQRDEHGYGMKVSGDNPVYVQSVKEHGAAWRAGLRAGDRILRVGNMSVLHHTHQQVVHMIRANPTTVLTVQQNTSRHKTPITAPVPVNPEKQRQLEVSKIQTVRLMLEQEQKYIRDLRNEVSKVPDVRKQAQLESAEQRCSILQHEIDAIMAGQPDTPSTPRLPQRPKTTSDKTSPPPNTGFLSGLPRSLSNLTGQSLRNLRQRQNKQQENQPPLLRQNSDENSRRKQHLHNNTVPMVPTTCLDNVTPPPLPPRSTERPKRNPLSPNLSPPVNPLAKPKPCSSASPIHSYYPKPRYNDPKNFPMHQSMPAYNENAAKLKRSSHSLDGELDGPPPNSIALQMSYPLVNAPPPPLQTDNRNNVPVLHVRSQSSPEHLDHEHHRPGGCGAADKEAWSRGTPPPGTPPPPYAHNTQPCADPQRAIISMEEDDSPASDNSTYSGLFSNLRAVRESKARTAVLLNWLLGERRCACANLLLVITDGYRAATGVPTATLRRWAYEIQSTFLMPNAVLQLNGVDENMANEIEQVLVNEYDKEELLRNVFRKARQKAKEELGAQLSEFQVKRQVGLGTLYGPEDAVIEKCDVDKAQEQVVVERIICGRLTAVANGSYGGCNNASHSAHAHSALLWALCAAALCLHCRPASVAAAVGGQRASFLQRDKLYKQRVKQLAKQHPQPLVVRGHHLQLQALTSVGHCHHCDHVIWGLAPQAYVCTDCKLRVHRQCAKSVEEGCCLDGEHHNNRISRFMERIQIQHPTPAPNNQDSSEKKNKKSSGTAAFLNMELRARKTEDEPTWEHTLTPNSAIERREESDESLYESADCHSDAISASDDALPRLSKTPTMSKESLKLAVTDEESEVTLRNKKGHRKTMSLSHPLEVVKTFSDEWFESKKDGEKLSDKNKSRESLWSLEDRDSIHGSNMKLDQNKKSSKKEDKNESNSRKSSTADPPKRKTSKASSVSALNFLRRKKTPTAVMKAVEVVNEVADKIISSEELLNFTKLFLEEEKRYSAMRESKPIVETDSDDEPPTPKPTEPRRRLSRQASRSKSKAPTRGKSQSLKVNTLRKSHSGTLKKGKKKSVKTTPLQGRSRQASIVDQTPILKKKSSDSIRQHSWLFSGSRGEARREGSTEDTTAADADGDADSKDKDVVDKDTSWRSPGARGVNRAESCRERDAPRRGKHRNASDPNRLTAINHNDLEPGAGTAPSGSSSSSSLSSRSNESNTVAAEQHASASEWSDEEEPLAAQWADSLPPKTLDTMILSARLRKRQELIHELIVSEGSHVRWLKVLGGIFLRPLEAQPSLLPPDELRALFPNLPGVRERHSKLYSELRALRGSATNHYVNIRPVADILLNTLGEAGYAACLSRFCRGQRMALDALKERRRKSKELHQFLSAREQLPVCGRLQLRDLLACVWQRLTKYQLLLEGILKTVNEHESNDSEEPDLPEDTAVLKRALDVAKDVLHSVDTAIRTAENEHRLRSIQSKLEIRIPCSGSEWEEAKRLELPAHRLRMEGELSIRNDSNKKMNVLALMLEDCLVLLQREGDKFVLRPIPQPSQQGLLSPLIKWERVLFRPNAAVRNAFFLMNINCIQMHELTANTHTEYQTWVRHMEELPLAKPELRPSLTPSLTPSHQPSRSTDDSGINVSRNPSDASEKSTASSVPDDEIERDRHSAERATDKDRHSAERLEDKDRKSLDREGVVEEKEEKHKPRRPTVGRISTHGAEPTPALLEPSAALSVHEPLANSIAQTAHRAYTHQERLRRLDEGITKALRAKSAVVAELLAIPHESFAQMAELAIADTLGQVDVCGELRAARLSRESSVDEESPPLPASAPPPPDMHQLLLAAQAQATQLTEALTKALSVNEAAAVAARQSRGRCDSCRRRTLQRSDTVTSSKSDNADLLEDNKFDDGIEADVDTKLTELADSELDKLRPNSPTPRPLSHLGGDIEPRPEDALESNANAAALATRLVGVTCGLQGTLGALLAALPALQAERAQLRRELAALRESNDALRARVAGFPTTDEICFPSDGVDQTIPDQPSNGG